MPETYVQTAMACNYNVSSDSEVKFIKPLAFGPWAGCTSCTGPHILIKTFSHIALLHRRGTSAPTTLSRAVDRMTSSHVLKVLVRPGWKKERFK